MGDRTTLHRAIRVLALGSESGELALALLLAQGEGSNDAVEVTEPGTDDAQRCCAAEAMRCIGERLTTHGEDLSDAATGPAEIERIAANLCAIAQILAGIAFDLRRGAKGSGAHRAAHG